VPQPGKTTGGPCFEAAMDRFPWPYPPPPTNQRVILKDYLASQDHAAAIAAALSADRSVQRPATPGASSGTARFSRSSFPEAKAMGGAGDTLRKVTPLATVSAAGLTAALADFSPVVPSTLGHLLRYLRLRLVAAGYPAPAVLGAGCNGFALILEGERIRPDGSRIGFEEWQWGRRLGFIEIIDKLMRGEPGFFRMITLVAAQEKPLPGGRPISAQELRRLLMLGSSGLPAGMEDIPFDDRYELYALVYEFEKDAKGVSGQVEPTGRISIVAHLRASGLLVVR
jgi:hypothetical protein